jgi:hypothetical protein
MGQRRIDLFKGESGSAGHDEIAKKQERRAMVPASQSKEGIGAQQAKQFIRGLETIP